MLNKIIAITIMSSLMIFTVGCFSEGGGVEFGSTVDFLSSRIEVLGQGVANGSSFLYIEVHALNNNGSPVTNFVPEISVTSGAGAVVHNCNATNSEGVARCAITSTVPGIKTLNLDNISSALVTEDAVFIMPVLSKTIISNVPGSTIVNTSGGYSVSASLSNMKAPLKYVDGSGHIVYSTVQGLVLSKDE